MWGWKKIIWSSLLQFEDTGTNESTVIFAFCSNKLYALSNASSGLDGKGSAWM